MYIYDKKFFYENIINIAESELIKEIDSKSKYYYNFCIPKKGGNRLINAIKKDSKLYEIQKKLNEYLINIPISNASKGFIKGQNYFDYLYPHINKKYYMRIDIRNFFNSINGELIDDALKYYCKFESVRKDIVNITMLNDKLPQGAVTSPVLSNIVFTRTDQRILKYCQSLFNIYKYNSLEGKKEQKINDIVYTRYADDLLFSSNYLDFRKSEYFLKVIKNILNDTGFKINYKKIKYGYNQIVLSGYVIGENIHLSRKKINNLNKIIYYFDRRQGKLNEKYKVDKNKINDDNIINNINSLLEEKVVIDVISLINYLCGYRSFLISVEHANHNKNIKNK